MKFARFAILLLISTGLMAWPAVSFADTVSIGLQEGGPITTVASAPGQTSFTGAFGTFSSITVAGHGQSVLTPPDLLFSDNIDTATAAGGTLMVWVTDQGLTSPIGTLPFSTSFTANVLPAGWTVTESSFVSATNALYSGTALSSEAFPAIGTSVQNAPGATGGGTYSVTEEFIVSATGAGDSNNTIDMSATLSTVSTREPPALIGFGLGLIGIGFLARRRVQST